MTTITPHVAAIQCPDALRSLQAWVCWRYEAHDGEAKPRKVPYYASGARRHGVQGRLEDRQQMVTFDAAKAAAARRGMDGVGFCPLQDFGIVALDFDHCIVDGGLHPDVERLVAGTYAEWSPSGQGVRAFMRGALGNRKAHGEPFGFETFSSKGFVTVTGNRLEITELTDAVNTVADINAETLALCTARFGRAEAPDAPTGTSDVQPVGLGLDKLREALDVLDPDLGYADWLRYGMAVHHEMGGSAEGFQLWDTWSAAGGKYPGTDKLQQHWDSFGRGGQRPTTAHALVRAANAAGAHIEIASLEADDFDVVAPAPAAGPAKPPRFTPVPAGDFIAVAPPEWLIKDVLPRAELGVIYGEPGAGKSFVALDLVGAMARGVDWRGHKTKRCRVIIIAAEGAGGMRKRIKAWAQQHDVDLAGLSIGVIHAAPNLMEKQDALDLCKAIQAFGGADVVLIDTLAQSMAGGNENAGEDMGVVLGHCRGVHVATKALVLLVHHAGKDKARGARGWSGIKGAADVEIEVAKLPTGRLMRLTKQKDGEDGTAWGFQLDVVAVGQDEDGAPITSCVVKEAEAPAVHQVAAATRGMGPVEKLVVAAISEMAQAQTAGIEIQAVIDTVAARMPDPDGKRDTRKQRARRALLALCEGDDSAYFLEDGCLSIV